MYTDTSMIKTRGIGLLRICEPGNGDLEALVEELRKEVVQGFLDSHARSNKNAAKSLKIAPFCYALKELLIEEGIGKWELGRPYLVARNADGYCRHLDRATCLCHGIGI